MKNNTENSQITDKPWLFKKGQSGNPGGRPKGKSLKDYTREMLAEMTDDERQNFLDGIPKEVIWKLAEGNPDTKNDLTSDGKAIVSISPLALAMAKDILKQNDNGGETIGDSVKDTEETGHSSSVLDSSK